jgi:hypothetical protein
MEVSYQNITRSITSEVIHFINFSFNSFHLSLRLLIPMHLLTFTS